MLLNNDIITPYKKLVLNYVEFQNHFTNGEAHGIRWAWLRTVQILQVSWGIFILIIPTNNSKKIQFGS